MHQSSYLTIKSLLLKWSTCLISQLDQVGDEILEHNLDS